MFTKRVLFSKNLLGDLLYQLAMLSYLIFRPRAISLADQCGIESYKKHRHKDGSKLKYK